MNCIPGGTLIINLSEKTKKEWTLYYLSLIVPPFSASSWCAAAVAGTDSRCGGTSPSSQKRRKRKETARHSASTSKGYLSLARSAPSPGAQTGALSDLLPRLIKPFQLYVASGETGYNLLLSQGQLRPSARTHSGEYKVMWIPWQHFQFTVAIPHIHFLRFSCRQSLHPASSKMCSRCSSQRFYI